MFNFSNKAVLHDARAQAAAVNRSQAVIEFNMDGSIITANQNFLNAMGYTLDEIRGRHHRIFVSAAERDSDAYRAFWACLNRGEFQTAEYKRVGKGDKVVWIQASYNPVLDSAGRPVKVIKFATDITAQKMRSLDDAGKIIAINRAQAVIEFNMDGSIITANENFLKAMGYALDEISGRHHSMFLKPGDADAPAYREFWARLNRGEYQAGEFKRMGNHGKEVWILASYNPILDDTGKPFKVVKFATETTQQKLRAADHGGQIEAIGKSQAVIEFNMDGTILRANDNFLNAMGYRSAEVIGQHHRMFVDPAEANSPAYGQFWESLRRGEYSASEFRRLAKGGREVWIQASYNPILDLDGKPCKVVKFAADVTTAAIARKKAERARGLIESVAAGSEEMSASIREISETMVKSRHTATDAVNQVDTADQQAQRLAAAAQSMGGIVELIGSITGQINLLALNATIESARAGEAGRGFAVVASEVKNLANQAKQATDRITTEIDALNGVSGDVTLALRAVKGAIEAVNEYVTSTAAAVEEQNTVTSDMSSNMQRAAAELA